MRGYPAASHRRSGARTRGDAAPPSETLSHQVASGLVPRPT